MNASHALGVISFSALCCTRARGIFTLWIWQIEIGEFEALFFADGGFEVHL